IWEGCRPVNQLWRRPPTSLTRTAARAWPAVRRHGGIDNKGPAVTTFKRGVLKSKNGDRGPHADDRNPWGGMVMAINRASSLMSALLLAAAAVMGSSAALAQNRQF